MSLEVLLLTNAWAKSKQMLKVFCSEKGHCVLWKGNFSSVFSSRSKWLMRQLLELRNKPPKTKVWKFVL